MAVFTQICVLIVVLSCCWCRCFNGVQKATNNSVEIRLNESLDLNQTHYEVSPHKNKPSTAFTKAMGLLHNLIPDEKTAAKFNITLNDISNINESELTGEKKRPLYAWAILPLAEENGKNTSSYILAVSNGSIITLGNTQETVERDIEEFNKWKAFLNWTEILDKIGSGALATLVGG